LYYCIWSHPFLLGISIPYAPWVGNLKLCPKCLIPQTNRCYMTKSRNDFTRLRGCLVWLLKCFCFLKKSKVKPNGPAFSWVLLEKLFFVVQFWKHPGKCFCLLFRSSIWNLKFWKRGNFPNLKFSDFLDSKFEILKFWQFPKFEIRWFFQIQHLKIWKLGKFSIFSDFSNFKFKIQQIFKVQIRILTNL
jgi:hypothetical protein